MPRVNQCLPSLFLAGSFLFPAVAAQPLLVVDRGLPTANLNNTAGASRSNVRWANDDHGFLGDDFVIGNPGERWVIDGIRTWAVVGKMANSQQRIGDFFQDIRLYFGDSSNGLTPVTTALLAAESNDSSNSSIVITEATANGTPAYEEFGTDLRVWQVDFQKLNLSVSGGTRYRFGVWAMGRQIPGQEGKSYVWFNYASNAPLSAVPQEGANGSMLMFDAGGKFEGSFQSQGSGWDKSSDINVQVFAHKVTGSKAAPVAQ